MFIGCSGSNHGAFYLNSVTSVGFTLCGARACLQERCGLSMVKFLPAVIQLISFTVCNRFTFRK